MRLGKESDFMNASLRSAHEAFIKIAAADTFPWLRFESGARPGG
jgi:hypothetical protein